MHIGWNFLDKRTGTINAIKAYDSMNFILLHTDEEILEMKHRMEGVGAQVIDGLPHAHDVHAGEKRVINCIEEIDTLKERYRQALEYMAWFKPAWDQLSDDERYILEAFFMTAEEGGAAETVSEELGVERSSVYNLKNKALNHLSLLLYGKV